MILVNVSVGSYQKIIDRSNSKPTRGFMPNRDTFSRPCATPNAKYHFALLLIFLFLVLLREPRKNLATEIYTQALSTGQRNSTINPVTEHKLLKLVKATL